MKDCQMEETLNFFGSAPVESEAMGRSYQEENLGMMFRKIS